MKLRPIMNNHVARKFACRREMGNNEFSWSGLSQLKKFSLKFPTSNTVKFMCYYTKQNILGVKITGPIKSSYANH